MTESAFSRRLNEGRRDEPDLIVLATLLDLTREIHGEVVQIADDTWAIHGYIPYEGDVIVAEFHERAVADELLHLIPLGRPLPHRTPKQPLQPAPLPHRTPHLPQQSPAF